MSASRRVFPVVASALLAFAVLNRSAPMIEAAQGQTFFVDDYVPQPAYAGQTRAPLANQSPRLIVTTVTARLENPYGLQFLPDGRMLVSELPGRLRIVSPDGAVSAPLEGVPAVWAFRSSGLQDLVLDPDFASNRLIYFAYAAPPNGAAAPEPNADFAASAERFVARARLADDSSGIEDVERIFEANARRLAFGPDGKLYMTTPAAADERPQAQDLRSIGGKVLRINRDGSLPDDNPLPDAHGAVFAYGFRDPSGAAFNPRTGELWTVEHGPRGGDELNIIRAGRNYGWPVITYGREYSEDPVGDGLTARAGMEQPNYFWSPSIAPSSLEFYTGTLIPQWTGNAFVSTLSGEHLARLVLVGDRVVGEERLFVGTEQRIRTVRQGPDGAVYLLIADVKGRLIRLTPKPVTNPFAR